MQSSLASCRGGGPQAMKGPPALTTSEGLTALALAPWEPRDGFDFPRGRVCVTLSFFCVNLSSPGSKALVVLTVAGLGWKANQQGHLDCS